MLPFVPGLVVRPLSLEDIDAAATLINRQLQRALYSAPLDSDGMQDQLFGDSPATLYPVRWQRRQLLGAWRAGELLGLVDVATGQDSESYALPDYTPVGLLRFCALPERDDMLGAAARVLLSAAEDFWRTGGVGHVKAYHISTGYPEFQAGAGLLPGDWAEQVRLLTEMGFHFVDRYYCLSRPLGQLFEEAVPQGGLSLAFRGDLSDHRYLVFFRRTELIAEARMVRRYVESDGVPRKIGYIAQWNVDERWRNQKIGRWLLRRLINDATHQGLTELVIHMQPTQAAATNLVAQHGFAEMNYRGYSLEKVLAN
jgi:ribosomal protein S18 acetylase RimI-like enzyme